MWSIWAQSQIPLPSCLPTGSYTAFNLQWPNHWPKQKFSLCKEENHLEPRATRAGIQIQGQLPGACSYSHCEALTEHPWLIFCTTECKLKKKIWLQQRVAFASSWSVKYSGDKVWDKWWESSGRGKFLTGRKIKRTKKRIPIQWRSMKGDRTEVNTREWLRISHWFFSLIIKTEIPLDWKKANF